MFRRLVIVLTIIGLAHNELVNLTCKEIRKFVDGHNTRRLQVAQGKLKGQPGAVMMHSVIWDEELAAKAEKWASMDPLSHNQDKKIEPATLDPDTPLSQWFEEHLMYKYGDGVSSSPYTIGNSGHYTQMVWSDSTYIGCAISKNQFYKMTKFTVVCNYGPAGNILGVAPYEPTKEGEKGTITLYCGIAGCSKPYGEKCASKLLRLSFDLRITN